MVQANLNIKENKMNMPKYNHNLSKTHNSALALAHTVASEVFKDKKFDSYEEAKKAQVKTSIDGYNFLLCPACKDMIEGKDYGVDSPFAMPMPAMLAG